MNQEKLIKELKNLYISQSKIARIFLSISFASLFSIILLILFFIAFLDPANDVAPIFMVIFFTIGIISLIVGIIFLIKKKITRGNADFYNKNDQNKFLKTYLNILIVKLSILFVGILLLVLGCIIREVNGMKLTFFGLLLMAISLTMTVNYLIYKKDLASKKSQIIEDEIKEYSIINNLSLLERAILLIISIAIIVLFFTILVEPNNLFINILIIILIILVYGYNLYTTIKCKLRYKKNNK